MRKSVKEYLQSYRSAMREAERMDTLQKINFINLINKRYLKGNARTLLDVACGKGTIDNSLKKNYEITAIDKDKKRISIARKNVPGVKFIQGDMQEFRHDKKFDIILCTDAIDHGYELRKDITRTIRNLTANLNKPGVIIFDVYFLEDSWKNNSTIVQKFKRKNEMWVNVNHREVREHNGLYYSTMLLIEGDSIRADTSEPSFTEYLLRLDTILSMGRKMGFSVTVYDGWKDKKAKKAGNEATVIVFARK